MIYPLSHAVITQYFGEHPDDYLQFGFPGHNGIDLVTVDSPAVVYAFSGGRCVKVGWQEEGYGKYIVIELGENQFYYCHLNGVFIKPGDQVIESEPIGLMGETGFCTGPHLHFAIRKTDGGGIIDYQGYINPYPLLRESLQPNIWDISTLDLEEDNQQQPTITTTKPLILTRKAGKPVTHGKRTMYPMQKIKWF